MQNGASCRHATHHANSKELPNAAGKLGAAYLGEGEEYVRVRLVARPVVRALILLVLSLAGPQHEEVAQ
jgi:hypothetical protein